MRSPLLAVMILFALPGVPGQGSVNATTATGEAQAMSQRGNRGQSAARQRFRAMDKDGDGTISRAEWRGSDQSFRVHDWNRDGVLSGTELREVVRQAQRADQDEDFDDTDTFNDWSETRFTAMDGNRDGRITRPEWPYDLDSFRRADRNRDGVLVRGEFLGGDFDDDRGDRFDFLDVDGNNRVTRDEWHASDEAFNWLDANRDGKLTRQEVEGDEAEERADQFTRLDSNRDNRVSRTEWRWSQRSFDQLDVNRDGVLTRREIAGSSVNATAETATVTVGGTTRWIDTGIDVYAGDLVRFQASGSIQMSNDASDVADPGGSRLNRLAAEAPLPRQSAGALIGRVGQGAPFFIGARNTPIRMPQTGRLFLSVNDDFLADNRGEFRVTITRASSSQQ